MSRLYCALFVLVVAWAEKCIWCYCRLCALGGASRRDAEVEKESLQAIYNATNGEKWTINDGWMNATVDHCQWYGSCDAGGFVTSIDWRDNNLEGLFPVYTRNVSMHISLCFIK
jgi:hypothetical protein